MATHDQQLFLAAALTTFYYNLSSLVKQIPKHSNNWWKHECLK